VPAGGPLVSLALDSPAIGMAKDIAAFTHDPTGFARYVYPWGEGDLLDSAGPRVWQAKVNQIIKDHLSSPSTRFQPCFIAISSGHGIGKSAEIAMVTDWAMSTCEDTKVIITAGTGIQLATKTAPEVSKWFRKGVNAGWWNINATSIRYASDKRQANWRADFITWSEYNTEAFAGLHNLRKRILLVFDEASAVADRVWEVAEGALTDEETEIIWLAFGNPTQNTGRFRECFGRFKHRWHHVQIDSRTVEGTNKAQIAKWIEDYGEDSDFVRVRVRGEFPRAGSSQFIASDVVAAARRYRAEGYKSMPSVLGVDVARFGDDQSVWFLRQGRYSRILKKVRGWDTAQVSAQTNEFTREHDPGAIVVDSDGIGAPVFDQLKFMGFGAKLYEFHGGKPAFNTKQYFNRRAEVWGLMRDWLNAGAEIPDDPELDSDLTGPEYGFSAQQQIQLEKKDDMKKRGLSSPDAGDALAMTFAVNLLPKPAAYVPQYGAGADSWMA
jgi:hypothetical protein